MNNLPTVTKNLLIINVLCFFGMLVAKRYGIDVENLLGLHFFLASDFNLSQLISYMFMHANFQHIFFNMFAVWMFGRVLEQVWGPRRFLTYYLICGIGAGLIQELVQYLEYAFTLSNYDSVNLGIAGGNYTDGRIPEYDDDGGSFRSRLRYSAGVRNVVP